MNKDISVIPSAKRLIESLRNMGHDFHTAIADLIDNSIAANSSEIHIMISIIDNEPYVLISDNGDGMDRSTIDEAMRFGANTSYNTNDLGKYGLGLKTASLSFCDKLTVVSKSKPLTDKKSKLYIRRWDLPYVFQKDEWVVNTLELNNLTDIENQMIKKFVPETKGTVVLWSDMKSRSSMSLLYDDNPILREKQLSILISETARHLSLVFHRYIEGVVKGKVRLKIYINESEIEPWDPFFKSEKETKFIEPKSFYIHDENGKKQEILFTPVVIPREDSISFSGSKKNAMEADSKNNQQGFYFYRNDRLIKAGGWGGSTGNAGIFKLEEHYKLLRIAVDFHPSLDKAFNLDISKMSAVLPSDKNLRKNLKEIVSEWRKTANQRYRNKNNIDIIDDGNLNQKLPDVQVAEIKKIDEKNNLSKSLESVSNLQDVVDNNTTVFELQISKNKTLHLFVEELLVLLEDFINGKVSVDEINIEKLKKEYIKYCE